MATTQAELDLAFQEVGSEVKAAKERVALLETVRPRLQPAQGAVIFGWDDGYASQYALLPEIEARRQKHVWYIISSTIGGTSGGVKMTAAQILDLVAKGHEIGSHSVTHSAMAPMSEATRYAEFVNSKTTLEALIGEPVTSFAYPLGSSNAAADSQANGIYGCIRQVSTTGLNLSPFTSLKAPIPFSHAGFSFGASADNIAMAMEYIRMAASQPIVLDLFIHQPDIAGEPTTAQILAAMDLCESLGVPVLTPREVFGRQTRIRNPNFDNALAGWNKVPGTGAISVGSKHATLSSNIVTLTSTATSGQSPYFSQLQPIDDLTRSITWSFRAIVNRITGTGGVYARIRYFDAKMAPVAVTPNVQSTVYATNAEGLVTYSGVPTAGTKYACLDIIMTGMEGTAQVFHPYFGDTLDGNYA